MQLPVTTINSKSKIALRRILPVEGEILVTSGQAVTASTPVARSELPARRQIVDVAWQLGRLHVDMDEVMQVEIGEEVEANQVVAAPKGGGSLFRNSVRAPVAGVVAMIGPGWVLLETEHRSLELQAFIPGTVTRVLGQQGVIIEAEGAIVEAACGFGGEAFGRLKRLVDSPFEALQVTALDESATDMIVLGGRTVDEETLRKADSWHVKGIIVGSIQAHLLKLDPPVQLPVVATEGFGNVPMSPHTFGVLTSLSRRDVSVRGNSPHLSEGSDSEFKHEPSIILAANPLVTSRVYTPPSPPGSNKAIDATVGSRVRVTYGKFMGASGTIEAIPAEPQATDTGIITPGATVKFINGRSYIPWANLQQIDG
jgi:hypothetical protein